MNKEEIKRALKYCKGDNYGNFNCKECPYHTKSKCNDTLCNDTLELITEQEKEIEKITEEINFWHKINETALILTEEECEHKVILDEDHFERALNYERENVRKETAKEILQYLYEKIGNAPLSDIELVNYLAQRYGVEVEE